ncbi:MAG: tetratricopeptide repeat protein [Oceanicoccus sp.]
MRFIRYSRICLICSFLLTISACQFVAEQPVGEMDEKMPNNEIPLSMVEKSATINPYLNNSVAVPDPILERFRKANEALANGDLDFSEQELRWIIEQYPDLSGPTLSLAVLHRIADNSEQAEIFFRKTIEKNHQNIYAYNQYGVFLREQGRFTDAEKAYQQALAIWPQYPDANINLAILYDLYMGRLESAVKYYAIYRDLLGQPDRKIDGWIIDAERRLASSQR